MAVFDESKVINALHLEKAEVGKKYYYANYIGILKKRVECDDENFVGKLDIITGDINFGFRLDYTAFDLLYPYEEPPKSKQRMTKRQFCEWNNRGKGQWKWKDCSQCHTNDYSYSEKNDNDEVDKNILIRPWDSDEWIEPTVDIYERDCRGGKE